LKPSEKSRLRRKIKKLKKNKKKQEPIFSLLEKIEPAQGKQTFTQALIPKQNEKLPEKTPAYFPESIGRLKSELPELYFEPSVPLPELFSFVFIPPGELVIGSPETELGRNEDEVLHKVKITKGFFLQTTPVTQKQWKIIMGNNPARFAKNGDSHPVESVSWYDCQKFIVRLNSLEKATYRLPTEAEWEYACRSGTVSPCTGGEIVELFCGIDPNLDTMGWYCGNSNRTTHPVAQKKGNAWGLFDMHGNVFEWCQDWYGDYPSTPQTDPSGPLSGPGRVIRGGSWFSNAKSCRSAARFYWHPNGKSDFIGFRLVKEE